MKAAWMSTWVVLVLSCGGDDRQRAATSPPVEPSPTDVPAGEDTAEPANAEDAEGWLALVSGLRVDMRVGRPARERGSTIEEVEAAVRGAGGSLDCSEIGWVSDEEGVEEGQCTGSLPIEGTGGIVIANFRRYAIPDEPETPGLLNISLGGPFLGNDTAIGPWLDAVRRKLEPPYGVAENAGDDAAADLRWRASDRFLVLHDPTKAPCGGECNAFLWVGGPADPQLSLRGF